MKKTLAALAVMISALASGCASYHPTGIAYTGGKMGVQASGEVGGKIGRACMHSIMGIAAFGDASVAAARGQAQIDRVSTIDYEIFNVLGAYGRYCLVVRGD